jgi:hypothetical protein
MSRVGARAHGVVMDTTVRAGSRSGRAREWLARYAPAEAGAIAGALAAAAVVGPFGLAAATAYAGAIGDGVGFYSVLLVRDLRRQRPGPGRLGSTVRGLVMEFGPAEVLDSVLVRPLAMYLAARWLGSAAAGVIVGKLAADAVFYALAIMAYELRKHLAARRHVQARGSARAHSRPAVFAWPGPTARPEEATTEAIDLSSVPTTSLVLNRR